MAATTTSVRAMERASLVHPWSCDSRQLQPPRLELPGGPHARSHASASSTTTDVWRRIGSEATFPTYRFGTRRAVAPIRTLHRVRPLMRQAGITRLADITGLDWTGVPVYQAIRPNSRTLSASQGKGLTRVQAKVSALMEALEGFHAEDIRTRRIVDAVGSMRRQLGYDLHGLALNHPELLNDGLRLEWLPATDLVTGVQSWVPRQLCNLDLCVDRRFDVPVFRTSSNGLCSGNTIAEALLHGLCEVIERDSCLRYDEARFEPDRCVVPHTISSGLAQQLLRQFSRAGMHVQITDISGPTGLPCFEVWLDHPDGPALTRGSGCHPAPAVALIRALTEAAQSRLTYIAGSRDDIPRRVYRAPTEYRPRRVFQSSPTAERSFGAAPTMPFAPFGTQIRNIAERIRALTGMSPMAVDLTRDDLQLPVFFVIAPGLGTRVSI